ncbi:MAG: ATP-dependent helicase, partial [Acidimicrobiales bacterium]
MARYPAHAPVTATEALGVGWAVVGASGPEAKPWDAAAAWAAMVARLPGAARRDGQVRMAEAVEEAVAAGRPLLVQAGAGTGKTLAYLAALAAAGRPAVVATATKTLQDQLAHKDLPLLAAAVAARGGPPLRWAVLKGRSNYLCRQRLAELGADGQLTLAGLGPAPPAAELARLAAWAETSAAGERSALTEEVSDASWTAVSVGPRECAGALRCPEGPRCFAEAARQRAAEADVVVVNHHLYALHLTGAAALPEHEVVVLDEAHLFE